MLVSENEEYTRLFNELLVILEPLIHLPFSFSIDFELRQVGNVWVCVWGGGICTCVGGGDVIFTQLEVQPVMAATSEAASKVGKSVWLSLN